ncbi:DUF935 domain-containing protein [Pectobacterium odoriferum]|uniref:DUF935 domain-containing protein n=1 Tax=Pectobacterium odoriferum TaxID=78398 RepID=UPI00050644F7|nr:DUF935 domain-containing protein [Pectobacterium odoriferum]KGA31967.1 Mu-like prophage FluMu protein gp29 [Pectobacterium odoriferum]
MAQIVDQHGRPLNRDVLKSPQTARVAQITRHFPEHPSRGLTIRRLPRILEAAERGDLAAQADLFEDMVEKDGHIFSEMAKRKNALLGLDWSIEPPRNATEEEKSLAAMVAEWMDDIPDFEDIILNAAEAIGHGFSAQEIEKWEFEENIWLPAQIKLRPHRWFCTNPEIDDAVRLSDGSMNGSELWPFGWLVHTHNAKSGYVAQSGLYRVLVWPYLFKNYSVRDFAEFLEIYGLPARVGTYMEGSSDEQKDALLHALVTLGHNAAGIIPMGSEIKFEAAAEGQSDPFIAMIDWCERTVSKAVLGGTLTSQADGKTSTNALGNVHNDVRNDILVADAKQLHGFFSHMIQMLLSINGYQVSRRRLPKLVFDTSELEDIGTFSTGVSTLVQAGMKTIPVSWIHKKVGIPVPQNNEPVLEGAPTPAPMTGLSVSPYRSFAALSTVPGEISDPAQSALDSARSTPEAINDAMQALIAPLVTALQQGQTPDDALDIIAASYPALDDSQLQQLLSQALFVADVWGRLNADT